MCNLKIHHKSNPAKKKRAATSRDSKKIDQAGLQLAQAELPKFSMPRRTALPRCFGRWVLTAQCSWNCEASATSIFHIDNSWGINSSKYVWRVYRSSWNSSCSYQQILVQIESANSTVTDKHSACSFSVQTLRDLLKRNWGVRPATNIRTVHGNAPLGLLVYKKRVSRNFERHLITVIPSPHD